MKKLFVLSSLLFVCLCACNQDIPVDNNQHGKSTNTEQIFKALNDSLMRLPHLNVTEAQTKGFWDDFKRWSNIALADARGARIGIGASKTFIFLSGLSTGGTGAIYAMATTGALCGSAASYDAYNNTKGANTISVQPTTQKAIDAYNTAAYNSISYAILEIPENYSHLNIASGMHNTILKQMHTKDQSPTTGSTNSVQSIPKETAPSTPERPVASIIQRSTSLTDELSSPQFNEYQATTSYIIQNNNFKQECTNISASSCQAYSRESFNLEKFIQSINNSPMTENEKSIFKLYTEVFIQYATNIQEVIRIANEYIKEINNRTNLSIQEKEYLIFTIAVSANSVVYWSQHIQKGTNTSQTNTTM